VLVIVVDTKAISSIRLINNYSSVKACLAGRLLFVLCSEDFMVIAIAIEMASLAKLPHLK